jgi:hypothetical protein
MLEPKRVALVDEGTRMSGLYQRALRKAGYNVDYFPTVDSFISQEDGWSEFSMFITDLTVPPEITFSSKNSHDGLYAELLLARRIRRTIPDTPVIVPMTTRTQPYRDILAANVRQMKNVLAISKIEFGPSELIDALHSFMSGELPDRVNLNLLRRIYVSLIAKPSIPGVSIGLNELFN